MLGASVPETEFEKKYHNLVRALIDSRMEHGDCKSGERYNGKPLACTACMAERRVQEEIAGYKGRSVRVAQWEIDAGKYEEVLQSVAQRLESVYALREVSALGLLEVPTVVDDLIAEYNELRSALKNARSYAVNMQKRHPLGFSAECGVSDRKMSQWTQDEKRINPDLF